MSKHGKRGQGINRIQRQGDARARQQEKEEHQTKMSSPHPVLGSQSGEGSSSATQQQPQKQRFWQDWNTIEKFTFWLVVFTAVYSFVSVWQGCATREANQIARDALVVSTRPWVGVLPFGNVQGLEVGKQPAITVQFKNFGKSPGFYVTARYALVVTRPEFTEKQIIAEVEKWPPRELGTLWPDQWQIGTVTSARPLTVEDFNNITNGTWQLAVIGNV